MFRLQKDNNLFETYDSFESFCVLGYEKGGKWKGKRAFCSVRLQFIEVMIERRYKRYRHKKRGLNPSIRH